MPHRQAQNTISVSLSSVELTALAGIYVTGVDPSLGDAFLGFHVLVSWNNESDQGYTDSSRNNGSLLKGGKAPRRMEMSQRGSKG